MSLSGRSTSGENQTSSDSNVTDAPRTVPSLEHWANLAQEELEIGQSLKIDGIHTAVCIDISDSMKLGDAWKQSKEFFTQFIQGLTENQEINDDEHVALSVFGRDVRVVQRLTNKYSHLQRAFDSLKIGGPSPLFGGLLMALAGVTSVTVGSVNGVKITSRIILVTDGHPTNPLLITGSDDFDPDKKKKNQVTAIQAADIIASKSVRIDCVPVGDADAPFLNLIASRTQGKVYSYKDGKMLGRRTAICCHAGHILNLWRMKSLFGSSGDTDTLLEQMDLHARDQIKSWSKDEQEEVLEIAKEARKTDIFFDAIRDFEYNYEFEDPDVKLPPLGTRVRRVPDLNNSQRDDCGPGTIVGHHKNKTQVRVEWDSNEKAELYYYGGKENNEVTVVDEPRLLQSNQLIATGCHVRRGKDWKYGNQDGTPGTIGVVVKVDDGGFVWVRWPDKRKNVYRFGASSKFDLEICRSRTADSATTPRQSSAPQPGPKSEDESFSDPLSSKSSQKGKDKIEEIYTRTAVKTTTQQSPTQRGLTSTTSTNMIPTTTTDTTIPSTTTIMMTSSTTNVVTRNTITTTDSTSSLATVVATSSETLTPSVLNMSSSITTNIIQNTTFHENEGASLSTNSLLSSSEPVSTSTQATVTTSRDSNSDSTQTATNTGNLDLSESVSQVSNTSYWDQLAELELVEAQMINTPGIHTVICIDTSESMREGSAWKETQQFFDEFIKEIEMITKETDIKDEQIALSVFGQEVKVVQRLCKNYRQLRDAFGILKIGGPTPMYGGLQMALAGFANPGKVGILNRGIKGLLMALKGTTSISVPVVNGIKIQPRIIIITDGFPTDTLLSSGPDVHVSTEEAKSDVMKAVRTISEREISIYIVPVGDADKSFLNLIADKADGQIVSYTDGRKLARRTINNLYAGAFLKQWKKDNEIARSFDTEMSLEDVMNVPADSQIASLSVENKVEVLHTAKQAIEKGLLDDDDDDDDKLEMYHYESDDKKVALPPLGTRVRRETNSDRLIDGDDDLGTIVGQHNIKKQVRVEWDKSGKSDLYRYGDEEKYDVIIVNEHRILQANEQIAVGCHVRRDWKWGNQGGKEDAVGIVIRVKDDKRVYVRWPDKSKNVYRFGADGYYDLELCDPSGNAIEGQTTSGITQSEQIPAVQQMLEKLTQMTTLLQRLENETSLPPQLLSMVKKLGDMTEKESDINLPPVGTQVRRVPDWISGQENENGLGSFNDHHEDKIRTPDENQTADGTTPSAQTSTPLKQFDSPSFIMPYLQTLQKFQKILKINRNAGRKFKEFDDPDVNLPSLGTRVRRGPDWDRGQQDEDGPGTIISHHKNKRQVLVEWDNNGTCDFYPFDAKDKQYVMVVKEPRVLQPNERIATGCLVRRGKDWKWDNQDGTLDAKGVVIQVQDDDLVWVRWPHKKRNVYRFGFEGCFDLEVCNPDEKNTVELETQRGHFLNVQHEANRTPSKVSTAVITSEMKNNGTTKASNDTSSSPKTSAITTTSSVNSNTTTDLPVRFHGIKRIIHFPDSVLGCGSYGTIVYKGRFDERDVAVKRLQKVDFYFDLADREVGSLRQSDQHPNIIRYYCNEEDKHFFYIALELCEGNLQDYVEDKLGNIKKLEPIELLHQTMKGLAHLHSLNIVHRDIKPHNILISRPGADGEVRTLISDFGFSRKLPPGKMSFSSKSAFQGTEAWAAPEMFITGQNKTPAVDIFSAGCVIYYVLTKGKHPFGNDSVEIQYRIKKGKFKLNQLLTTSDGYIAKDIIQDMLSSVPEARPTAKAVLRHLLFWNKEDKLRFIEGPKSEDESFSDPLSSKSSQKGKDKIEESYNRTEVKTTTQQSPTQRGLTSTTSTNIIPTTTTGTSIPATTTVMMTSSTTNVVTRNTLTTTDSTSSLTTVMATSSETSTSSVLNMSSSTATNTPQNTTLHENEGASLSTNSLLSSSEPVSTSTQATATTSTDSSSDSAQTATNTDQNPEEDTRFIECITESNFRKIGLLLKNRKVPSKSTIIHAIKEHGYSKGIQCLLRGMCNLLRKQIPDAIRVWSGYRPEDLPTPVFVVMLSKKASIPEKMKFSEPYDDYEIVFRNEHTPNDEEERVSEQSEVHANTINKEDMARVLYCIAENTERLMNEHSNLSIISASTVKAMGFNGCLSKRKLVESMCIVLYVPFKGIIPMGEKEFLKDIDGISTDVREGEFVFHGRKKAHKWYPKLPMGCRISTRDQQYGTLGGFVELPGGKTGCITAAHVVLNEKERKHYVKFKKAKKERYNESLAKGQTIIEVYQPTCKRDAFGNVYQIAFEEGNKSASSVDAAVIEITDHDRTPYTGLFPSGNYPVIGFTKENPMMYNSGKTRDHSNISTRSRVVKYGCSTNITHGEMVWNGSSVRVLNTRGKSWNRLKADNISYPKFFKQMVVKSSDKINFSEPGDSGALVFIYHSSSRDLEAIGLLIGASTHRSPERMYIVTPIEAVFQKLGLKNVMFKRFPDINQGEQNPAMNDLIYSRQLPESHHEISDTRINELKEELKATKLEINAEMKEIKSEIKEIQDAVRANTISLEQIKASTSVLEQTIIGLLSKPGGDAGKG